MRHLHTGHAMELIQLGKQVVFAGGGEELDWSLTMMFDAMGALSTKYNDTPELASRTYDAVIVMVSLSLVAAAC